MPYDSARYGNNPRPHLLRTRMCNRHPDCPYSEIDCWFAHYEADLRCFHYAMSGTCPMAAACTRLHTHIDVSTLFDATSINPTSAGRSPPAGRPAYMRGLPPIAIPQELQAQIARGKDDAASARFSQLGRDFVLEAARSLFSSVAVGGTGFGAAQLKAKGTPRGLCVAEAMDAAPKAAVVAWLRGLLFTEHAQALSDIRRYDIRDALLERRTGPGTHPDMCRIACLGLAEKRPSVLRGDAVFLRSNDAARRDANAPWHEGRVWFVNQDHLVCTVDVGHVTIGTQARFHVVFNIPQTPFLSMHRALDAAALTTGALLTPSLFRNRHRLAVLHGPPGTGKTTTVVAAVAALLAQGAEAHKVAVFTPSNNSADLVVDRLHAECAALRRDAGSMLRVHGEARDLVKDVKYPTVLQYSPQHTTRSFPTLHNVRRSLVTVSTLMTAGKLYGIGASPGDFTHVVVDEAGQATETELLIAMQLVGPRTQVVLAGDPKQLGPILRSGPAADWGFALSPLERLAASPAVERECTVMLRRNYRAHPDIIALYNATYGNKLIPAAVPAKRDLLAAQGLRRVVRFIHVDGHEAQEEDSPSWMNQAEAHAIVTEVARLKRQFDRTLGFGDMAVLCPYAKQCDKIRGILHHKFTNLEAPFVCPSGTAYDRKQPPLEVCSVERFQGREAPVVFLSCVRSTERLQADGTVASRTAAPSDAAMGIGFLKQPQRVNVAVSRAEAAMVIVGNALALCRDDTWFALLRTIADQRGLEGVTLGQLTSARTAHASAQTNGAARADARVVDGEWGRTE